MVRLTAQDPVVIYRILDGDGAAIGEIRQPMAAPAMGRGAETVLLVRADKGLGPEYGAPATAA